MTHSPGAPKLRIPIIAAGNDPGGALTPACAVLDLMRLGAMALRPSDVFVRPFAYVLSAPAMTRVPDLGRPGQLAIVTRAPAPLDARRVYAVRREEGVELARVLWNGRELLLIPAAGRSDFVVLDAADEGALRARIVGFVVRVLDPLRAGDPPGKPGRGRAGPEKGRS